MAKKVEYEWHFCYTDINDTDWEYLTKSEYGTAEQNFQRTKEIFEENKHDKYFELEISKWIYDNPWEQHREDYSVYPKRDTDDLPKWVNKIIDKLLN
tara:strand:- start:583 stop:873 length:291 start_codon:yes stop_codon:yes gene_type:complete